mgnify:CR=1 FL=1
MPSGLKVRLMHHKSRLAEGRGLQREICLCANCSGVVRSADTVTPRSAVCCRAAYSCSYRWPSRARSRCSKYSVGIFFSSHGMYKAAGCGHTMDCEGDPAPTATTERSIHTMENRSENRSTNCKNQTSNRTSKQDHQQRNQRAQAPQPVPPRVPMTRAPRTPPTAVPPTQKTAADGVSSI